MSHGLLGDLSNHGVQLGLRVVSRVRGILQPGLFGRWVLANRTNLTLLDQTFFNIQYVYIYIYIRRPLLLKGGGAREGWLQHKSKVGW